MNVKLFVTIGCMSVFAVSCAHKPVDKENQKITQEISTPETKSVHQTKPIVSEKKNGLSMNCVLGQDTRTITLQKGDKRCEVHYTKSGNSNHLAWAEQTPTLCDKVFDNVRVNIEKGGFKCSDESQKTASINN